ncbi:MULTISPECIES: DsrE family protein [Sulfurimonas]|uniref:DsrE family protein n=1 Tax=Sulfurimonas TaxID=202746 RepID=UPI00125FDC85|nr:DsrE family protein [Sulfurimonas hydrogeniphila]
MKKVILILTLLLSLVQAEDENAKAVYDLTTKNLAKFERNILKGIVFNKTLYANQLKELDVAVVIHGGAYRFFVKNLDTTIFKNDQKLQKAYKELKQRIATMADTYDVEFLMCGAAMDRNRLTKDDIVPFVKIIPNSTIGLINKQNDGFAYIPVGD